MKPKLFIGSSVEGLPIAYAAQSNLRRSAEVTVWDQGIFGISSTALDSLAQALNRSDFGLFILSADDLAIIRNNISSVARDNVIFELGLFIGKLGKERCYFVIPEDDKELHLPSDLLGIQPAIYETNRSDNNLQAATATACFEIRDRITKLGPLERGTTRSDDHPQDTAQKTTRSDRAEALIRGEIASATVPDAFTSPQLLASDLPKPDGAIVDTTEEIEPKSSHDPSLYPSSWTEAFVSDKYDDAIALLQKEIDSEKATEEIARSKALIALMKYFKGDRAWETEMIKVIDEYPNEAYTYSALVHRYIAAHRFDSAFSLINQFEQKTLLASDASILRVAVFEALGQEENAISELENGLNKDPNNAELRVALAKILKKLDQGAKAVELLCQSLQLFPTNRNIMDLLADYLDEAGMKEAALFICNRLTILESKNSRYLTLFANRCLDLNLYDFALTKYEEANALSEEKQEWIVANIGNILSARGFFSKGIEFLKKAVSLESDSQYAHDRLATALKQKEEEACRLTDLLKLGQKKISELANQKNSNPMQT